ncbi:MAG: hypothetical protein JST16_05200 [Bdellovibrionales bacterium]|nr:hypothetical protein [Bdellovibrionales bacterium]
MGVKPKARRPKTMEELFKACPHCGSTSLTSFADEMFCRRCDWNSMHAHAAYMVRFEEAAEADDVRRKRADETEQGGDSQSNNTKAA